METGNQNIGLNLPANPPNGATPFNQFSPYLPPPKPTEVAEPTLWERCSEFLNSKKVIETAIWLTLMVLFVPSGMAVASWNAVPGDLTYSWKTGLEKGLLLVLKPSKTLQTSTQVALTQRRFEEVSKMLQENEAQVGLKNLSDQVETTSNSIQSLSAGSSKTQFTMQYIEALTELNQKLEQEKKRHQGSSYKPRATARKPGTPAPVVNNGSVAQGNAAKGGSLQAGTTIIQNTYVQNTIMQNAQTNPDVPNIPAVITPPVEPVDQVTSEITEAQEQIEDAIAELQTQNTVEPVAEPTSEPAPEPTAAPAPTNAPATQASEPQSLAPKAEEPKDRSGEEKKVEEKKNEDKPAQDSSSNSNSNSESSNQGSGQ